MPFSQSRGAYLPARLSRLNPAPIDGLSFPGDLLHFAPFELGFEHVAVVVPGLDAPALLEASAVPVLIALVGLRLRGVGDIIGHVQADTRSRSERSL
jgi:hypothetical protein